MTPISMFRLVRPIMGRHVIARTEASNACTAEIQLCSAVPATSQDLRDVIACGHRAHGCIDTVLDNLERDLVESWAAQHATPGVLRAAGVEGSRSSSLAVLATNRFCGLATDSDDEHEPEVNQGSGHVCVPASDRAAREVLARIPFDGERADPPGSDGRVAVPVVHIAGIDSENLSDTATDHDCKPVVAQPLRRRRLALVPQPTGGTRQSVQDCD